MAGENVKNVAISRLSSGVIESISIEVISLEKWLEALEKLPSGGIYLLAYKCLSDQDDRVREAVLVDDKPGSIERQKMIKWIGARLAGVRVTVLAPTDEQLVALMNAGFDKMTQTMASLSLLSVVMDA